VNDRPKPTETVSAFPLAVGLVVVLAPPALLVWVAAAAVLRFTRAARWHLALGAALLVAAVTVAAGGPQEALEDHFRLWRVLGDTWASTGVWELSGALWRPGLWRMVPLGVAVGLAAAAANRPAAQLVPKPPDPLAEQRAAARQRRRADRLATRVAAQPAHDSSGFLMVGARPRLALPSRVSENRIDPISTQALLGVDLGGDLQPEWHSGKYVILPDRAARLPRLVLGRPGAGKSVYLTREAYLSGLAGRRLIVLDAKGEQAFAAEVVDAYTAGWSAGCRRPAPTIHLFPAEPLSIWDAAHPQAVVNKLLNVWAWSVESLFYKEVCTLSLRLAIGAPGRPVASMVDLVQRLDAGTLARLWPADAPERGLVDDVKGELGGVRLRIANLAAAAAGMFDGARALGEADCTVISLPSMAQQADSESVFRVLMADAQHWASARKRPGAPAHVIVDEFGALQGGQEPAINLLERGRSAGVPVTLATQSRTSLGDERQADRLLGAAGAVVLFASPQPDEVAKLAGTLRGPDAVWQADGGHLTGRASVSVRSAAKVDGNSVRQLGTGEAFILTGGRAGKVLVVPAPRPIEPPAIEAGDGGQ
jgi:hypothetical protein